MIITKNLINAKNNYGKKIGFIDNGRKFTYEQLASRAAKVKSSLQQLHVKKEDRVAILMPNSAPYLEIAFGLTSMGSIIVPLNVRLNVNELAYILNNSGAETLFIGSEFLSLLPKLAEKAEKVRNFILLEVEKSERIDFEGHYYHYEELLRKQPEKELTSEDVSEEDIAGLFYTSGTTGRPKGAIHTHKSLFTNGFNQLVFARVKPEDVFLHSLPMFHIGGFVGFVSRTMIGCTHVALRSFDPTSVLELCQKEKLTAFVVVPTMANMLLNHPDFDQYDLSSVETISYGASPMPLEILRKLNERLPHVQFSQGYGSTETASAITMLTKEQHDIGLKGTERERKRLLSAGQSVGGVEIKVVGPDGQEVPQGHTGEIIAKGPMIMKGYWNLPEETSRTLRDGWYYTGDVGYRDEENFFYIVDRAKDMIITGGENVYSIEVENVLYKHPKILECAVIGVPDEKWVEAVKALIVVKPGQQITEGELIEFVRGQLANYKVPKSFEFLSELPKNGAGKIQKYQLRKKYQEDNAKPMM